MVIRPVTIHKTNVSIELSIEGILEHKVIHYYSQTKHEGLEFTTITGEPKIHIKHMKWILIDHMSINKNYKGQHLKFKEGIDIV